jgi:hypothetical protein
MTFLNRISRPTLALACVNVLVALVVVVQLLYPANAVSAIETPLAEGNTSMPDFGDTTRNQPRIADLVDMLDRPLFFVARRMPEPPAEKPAAPPTPLRLELEGIAIAGGSRVAVLRNLNSNSLLQLAEGDEHDGWTLDSVGSTSASFKRGEQMTELLLDPSAGGRRR